MSNFLVKSMLSTAFIICCFSASGAESFSFFSIGSALKEKSEAAGHKQNCNLTYKYSCGDKSTKLVCSPKWNNGTGQCICESGQVYEDSTQKCWPTIGRNSNQKCYHDVQCIAGDWGSNSRCNEGKCECFHLETDGNTEMVLEDGGCRVKRLCEEKFIFASKLQKCLPVASKYGDDCEIDKQCQMGALGNLSRCFIENGESVGYCECYSESGRTAYYPYPSKCYMRKQYNDSCTDHNECRASLGRRVKCDFQLDSENYNKLTCYCPTGIVCRSDTALEYLRGLKMLKSSGGLQLNFNFYLTITCFYSASLFLY